jgi:hypothetical protein
MTNRLCSSLASYRGSLSACCYDAYHLFIFQEQAMPPTIPLTCTCGQLQLEVTGQPIISAACYCNSCRAAGVKLQTLPGARPAVDAHGATRFVLYRKDRTRFHQGTEQLRAFRLTPEAKTQRVVAICCNTPVFLELSNGHWLSLYGGLWPEGTLPPLQIRTMTSDLPTGTALPKDSLNSQRHTLTFFAKLLGAWVAMGFRSPKMTCVQGELKI